MEKQDFSRIGEEIKNSVQDAISNGDFSRLNMEIRDSVNCAMDELKRSFGYDHKVGGGSAEQQAKESFTSSGNRQEDMYHQSHAAEHQGRLAGFRADAVRRADAARRQWRGDGTNVMKGTNYQPAVKQAFLPVRPIGKVGGILFTVFGSILFGVGLILLLVFGSVGAVSSGWGFLLKLALVLALPMGGAGLVMLMTGRSKLNRVSRMNGYVKFAREKGFCSLRELAERTGRSMRFVLKDLKKMMRMGMLPEGHVDEQKTCFILDNKTHQLYLDMMKSKEDTKQEEDKPLEEHQEDEIKGVVTEGREYINQIRLANAAIPGKEISGKLELLSVIMDKIFVYIERHPEKVEEIHKFMDYYLPTTLKLVNTYREFDAQPVQGENITTAKREIEETLDTINQAFATLFDNLFADAALDISTDIDVLQTLFAQEGLTGDKITK